MHETDPQTRENPPDPTERADAAVIDEVRSLDIDGIWAEIEAVPGPGPDPALPSDVPLPRHLLPWAIRANKGLCIYLTVLVGLTIAGALLIDAWLFGPFFLLLIVTGAYGFVRLAGWTADSWPREDARTRWEDSLRHHARELSEKAFEAKRADLRRVRDDLKRLQRAPAERHPRYRRIHRHWQRRRFLSEARLADADIPGLDAASRDLLRARGVETAADCDTNRLVWIIGDVPGAVDAVRAWRDRVSKRFKHDPGAPLSPGDARRVAESFREWQEDTVAHYCSGPHALERLSRHVVKYRPGHYKTMARTWEEVQREERRHRRQPRRR